MVCIECEASIAIWLQLNIGKYSYINNPANCRCGILLEEVFLKKMKPLRKEELRPMLDA